MFRSIQRTARVFITVSNKLTNGNELRRFLNTKKQFQNNRYFQQKYDKLFTQYRRGIIASTLLCAAPISFWSINSMRLNVPSKDEAMRAESYSSSSKRFRDHAYDKLIAEYKYRFHAPIRDIVPMLEEILDRCGSWNNKIVCEIGSGTGFLAFPIIDRIGSEGHYIGLDVSPVFVHYLDNEIKERGLKQHAIIGRNNQSSLTLPEQLKNHVDTFVLCDTYYELEQPSKTMQEIYQYLKPGGQLIVIDFKRLTDSQYESWIEEQDKVKPTIQKIGLPQIGDRDWVQANVEFTPIECREQIELGGLAFKKEVLKGQLKQHFVYIFKKPRYF